MRKIFYAALFVILVSVPMFSINQALASNPPLITPPLQTQSQKKAVILSSLEQVYPLGYYDKAITYYLTHAGYQVTTLTNTAVTIDFLLTQLNNYNVVIWRTNTYNWKHVEYWYVGEKANSGIETKYASDFAKGWINGNAGIVGVSLSFFSNHFTSHILSNVKLMILISTDSNAFAPFFTTAGAGAVIFCNGPISLGFGLIDDLTNQLTANLASGKTVYYAVFDTVSPYSQNSQPKDPLDSNYAPPFWYVGDGTLTIT